MVLNTDTRDKNGKILNKDKVSDDEEPSTNRKRRIHTIQSTPSASSPVKPMSSFPLADNKKNLNKPKAAKSEYEGKIFALFHSYSLKSTSLEIRYSRHIFEREKKKRLQREILINFSWIDSRLLFLSK